MLASNQDENSEKYLTVTEDTQAQNLRAIPSVDAVLRDARIGALAGRTSVTAITRLVRTLLDESRQAVLSGASALDTDQVVAQVITRVENSWINSPQRVINATGVVLHTNLGRAPLSPAAIEAAGHAAAGYSDLEFDLDSGKRGSRNSRISRLISDVTGAEAGIAVNNNASAVLLCLSAIAEGREVIVSRGESVEIGGGFRIPDVMRRSGAKLVEVGTTNRTYAGDYSAAVTDRTAAILKVHPSNFSVNGFTHTPELVDLVAVGREHNVPVLNDLGSGTLLDTRPYGLQKEPTVQESISHGAALTMFSGDKLLGGPQAGIVCGDRGLIEHVGRHPVARALRIDKMTLAALAATLTAYLNENPVDEIPIWRMISAHEDELIHRAMAWRDTLNMGEVRSDRSAIGGGSLPGETLPTSVLAVGATSNVESIARLLRSQKPPIVGRIHESELLMDPRTVLPEEDSQIVAALKAIAGEVVEPN